MPNRKQHQQKKGVFDIQISYPVLKEAFQVDYWAENEKWWWSPNNSDHKLFLKPFQHHYSSDFGEALVIG